MIDSRFGCEASEVSGAVVEADFECVCHARNRAEASRFRTILDEYGIPARLGSGLGVDETRALALAGLPLLVPAAELDRASEILARFELDGADWEEEDDEFEDDEEEEEEDEDDYFPDDEEEDEFDDDDDEEDGLDEDDE